MELKEFIKIIKKNFLFLLLFALLGAFVGYFLAINLPQGYRQEQSFYLSSPKNSQEELKNLQNFFIQEKTRNFTDTAVAILESPDFQAELPKEGSLSIRKVAPQVIRISAQSDNREKTEDLVQKTVTSFNQKIFTLSDSDAFILKPIGKAPEPAFYAFSKKIALVLGLTVGAIFAVFVVGLKRYFLT